MTLSWINYDLRKSFSPLHFSYKVSIIISFNYIYSKIIYIDTYIWACLHIYAIHFEYIRKIDFIEESSVSIWGQIYTCINAYVFVHLCICLCVFDVYSFIEKYIHGNSIAYISFCHGLWSMNIKLWLHLSDSIWKKK